MDNSPGNDPANSYTTGSIEIQNNKLSLYGAVADTTPTVEYLLTDINYLNNRIVFEPKQLETNPKVYIKAIYKKYVSKIESVAKIESGTFASSCLISFVNRKVEPTVNGQTMKNECLVICLPKVNTDAIKKSFVDLLDKRYGESMKKETDQFKVPQMPVNYNMSVKYFSPNMLGGAKAITELETYYVDLNENGISFNTQDVSCLLT